MTWRLCVLHEMVADCPPVHHRPEPAPEVRYKEPVALRATMKCWREHPTHQRREDRRSVGNERQPNAITQNELLFVSGSIHILGRALPRPRFRSPFLFS
jgi:hypothetical protein